METIVKFSKRSIFLAEYRFDKDKLTSQSTDFKNLEIWITYLKDKTYNVNMEELKRL